jgi:hypothetical protein
MFEISIDLKLFPLRKRNDVCNFVTKSRERYKLEDQVISISLDLMKKLIEEKII